MRKIAAARTRTVGDIVLKRHPFTGWEFNHKNMLVEIEKVHTPTGWKWNARISPESNWHDCRYNKSWAGLDPTTRAARDWIDKNA
jgi:hypothetical protein